MRLEIDRWVIRKITENDIPALVKYANNRKVSINLRDRFPFPYTERDGRAWIEKTAAEPPPGHSFIIADERELIGGIGLEMGEDIHRHSAEIGYWLGEPFWGQGIATRAVLAMTRFGFERFGLTRIFATVMETNPSSAAVLEKAGYSFEGRLCRSVIKDGRILDELMYAIVKT